MFVNCCLLLKYCCTSAALDVSSGREASFHACLPLLMIAFTCEALVKKSFKAGCWRISRRQIPFFESDVSKTVIYQSSRWFVCRDWSDCGSGTDSGQEEDDDDTADQLGPRASRFSGSPRYSYNDSQHACWVVMTTLTSMPLLRLVLS